MSAFFKPFWIILACLPALGQRVIFSDGFESGDLNPAFWQAHPGEGGVVEVLADEDFRASGFFGARMGRVEIGDHVTNSLDLHLDLSDLQQVQLAFDFKHFADDTDPEDGLWFSDNGGEDFTQVFPFDPSGWFRLTYGSFPSVDVDRLAMEHGLALTDQFVIRWQQRGGGAFGFVHGFSLDNILVTEPAITYATLPFTDSFESGEFGTQWAIGDPTSSFPPGTFSPMGLIDVAAIDNLPDTGVFAARIGRRSRGFESSSALDLHLNLAGHSQVELTFTARFNFDAIDVEDGIWLSDDGGESFRGVMQLDEITNAFSTQTLDIDQLAREVGLHLTSRFIIRFQEHSAGSFGGVNGGLFLDAIEVTGDESVPRPVAVVPWVVNNAGFQSKIAIFNNGPTEASAILTGTDRDGNTQTTTVSIPADSVWARPANEVFDSLTGYALTVHSRNPKLFTSFLTFNIEEISGGSSPSQTTGQFINRLTTKLLFGYVPGDQTSAVVLVAPEATLGPTEVDLTLFDGTGDTMATTLITLTDNRPLASLITTLFPDLAIPKDASLIATSRNNHRLAGTTFVFNTRRQPSMAAAFSLE